MMNTNQNSNFERSILSGLLKIHQLCVGESDLVRLEYLYYTDLDLKGEALAEDLKKLNYVAEVDATHHKCDCTRVFGNTTLLRNDEDCFKQWYLEMRDVGNYHGCDFFCYSVIENPVIKMDDILRSKQVVSEEKFENGQDAQEASVPMIMDIMRELGDQSSEQLALEFFFYTDKNAKAESLAEALSKCGYDVFIHDSGKTDLNLLITGKTIPLPSEDKVVEDWAKKMNELGYIHDCQFDGWGTVVMKGGWFSDDTPDDVIRKRLGLPPREE